VVSRRRGAPKANAAGRRAGRCVASRRAAGEATAAGRQAGRSLVTRSLAACLLGVLAAAGAAEPEYAVKAAYLVKFPFFVEWPASAFASPTAPLVLCVIGDDPFGSLLDEAAGGQEM